jgi:hypothetical protein
LSFSLELIRHQFGQGHALPPKSVAVPVGLLMLAVFASEGIWRLARHISVIAHEGAHALAGWSTGHKVVGVKLNRDATGETATQGRDSGFGRITTAFAGYLGPSLFGLGAASLIALGDTEAVLWLAVFALTIMLFWVRNFFGVISVLINAGLFIVIMGYGSANLQVITAYGLSWFLLLSGVRFVLMHGSNASDAASLRKITHVPRIVWSSLWLVTTVTALWIGGRLLI